MSILDKVSYIDIQAYITDKKQVFRFYTKLYCLVTTLCIASVLVLSYTDNIFKFIVQRIMLINNNNNNYINRKNRQNLQDVLH